MNKGVNYYRRGFDLVDIVVVVVVATLLPVL